MSRILFELKLLRYRLKDTIIRRIAWRLPNRLVMWCYMRVGAHATTGKYSSTNVVDLSMMEAIDRFSKDNNLND